jgi:hypothetical protein
MTQGTNRRAALGAGDKHEFGDGRVPLESRQQRIVRGRGQLIDAAATRRTVAEVGGDVAHLRLGQLALGQGSQRVVSRVVQPVLGHDKRSGFIGQP